MSMKRIIIIFNYLINFKKLLFYNIFGSIINSECYSKFLNVIYFYNKLS